MKSHSRRRRGIRRPATLPLGASVVALVTAGALTPPAAATGTGFPFDIQSLDGRGNNIAHPTWGMEGTTYPRLAPARYLDGHGEPVTQPGSRYVSNRVFTDEGLKDGDHLFHPNFFAENMTTQWSWAWGQFVDHNVELAKGTSPEDPPGETANIPVDNTDPMEVSGIDRPGEIPFSRSDVAPGTGVHNARQQVNDLSSYLDGYAIYGGDEHRLEWLRQGPVDGDMSNNSAKLLLPGGYLPRRDARGDPDHAPLMELDGGLPANPASAVVAGDTRANENLALTGIQTLFAREHNRIVDELPGNLSEEAKFQIARRVVIAEIQYVTYNEFLPSMGITLPPYQGYRPTVNASVTDEFATIGFRLHSTIHGALPVETSADRYTQAQIDAFKAEGLLLDSRPGNVELDIPIDQAIGRPDLVPAIQLGPLLQGLDFDMQYLNDEIISHRLRDITCPASSDQPACITDLGAVDLERSRDHGMPTYNQLRQAYGLPTAKSFTDITGESSEDFPSDPLLTPGNEINELHSLDYTGFTNIFGTSIPEETGTDHIFGFTRRTPLAARLKAIYGSVSNVDAYVGMLAEKHPTGRVMGPLQQTMLTREFQRQRDGDRFFYGNQTGVLNDIKNKYGIDYRHDLGDIVAANTDIPHSGDLHTGMPGAVFFFNGEVPPASCRVNYKVTSQTGTGSGDFGAHITVTNTGTQPINGWTLRYRYLNGQKVSAVTNGDAEQNGVDVPISNTTDNAALSPGASADLDVSGTWMGTNPDPSDFTFNTRQCTTG